MNSFAKLLLISLIVIIFPASAIGQKVKSKVFLPDDYSRSVIQKRDISKYFDGGAFRCGFSGLKGECDYEEIRKVIWQCWSEKTLCYLTISWSGIDSARTEHVFVEPDQNNQWLIARRAQNSHAVIIVRKSLQDLPKAYSVEWRDDKNEKVLIFKNKLGKVIDEF